MSEQLSPSAAAVSGMLSDVREALRVHSAMHRDDLVAPLLVCIATVELIAALAALERQLGELGEELARRSAP